jgi:AraC family ethanolamine operon transcriptional activator
MRPMAASRLQTLPPPTRSDIAWACVRYAEEARFQNVTLPQLCSVARVSERTVRDAFYQCFGMSPTVYLRIAALREVHRVLIGCPTPRDAVTRAASDFGFFHLSRFAAYYRAVFGESPSQTVMRARSSVEAFAS